MVSYTYLYVYIYILREREGGKERGREEGSKEGKGKKEESMEKYQELMTQGKGMHMFIVHFLELYCKFEIFQKFWRKNNLFSDLLNSYIQ